MTTEYGRFRFYAVRRGRVLDIYRSREECEQQVNGFRNNEHRGFHDLSEALAWLRSAASPPAHQPTPHVQPEINSNDERVLFGFTVVLPHNGIGLDLMGHGSLCYEERVARQEVSFTMLDMIFGAIGYTIHDYNYHILGRVKERMNRSRVDRVGRLTERICILEMENEELSGQVEMFGEMLEE
ncbi:hypothetical protein Ahy_A10g048212 [Arachis hypogaea]|uniref:Ribonuclease H1 N-terminal domain-containing protein n=1 Tax=Arachis hypogaea TaxID=3818 RepID=A0A445B4J5_ARAHY|nr:hypothetical protein Ahy_A10g048212 [Arachis hypogaea]